MEPKKPYLSKTLWVNLAVAALVMFAPGAAEAVQANPEAVMVVFSVINVVLRLVTKNAVQLY